MAKLKNERWSIWLKAVIYGVVIAFVVTIFYNWGGGGKVGKGVPDNANWIAMVDGETIPIQAFVYRYKSAERRYSEIFGDRFDAAAQNLGFSVLNELIQANLAAKEAERLGFKVSEKDLSRSILEIEDGKGNFVFKDEDGNFVGVEIYRKIIEGNLNIPATLFEEQQRIDILTNKLRDFLKTSVVVTDDELMTEYKKRNERVSLDYILFDIDSEKDIKITEKDKIDYFNKHKEDFRTKEQRRAIYASFRADELSDEVSVEDSELKAYYEDNKDILYTSKDERRASHILFKTKPSDSEKEKETVKKKAETVLAKAKAGEDFSELAKTYSEDSSAANGGDLGFFDKNQMVPAFSEAAFSLGKGEISDVVESRFGYHIIKVTDVKEAGTLPFEEVKDKISKVLKKEKALELAKEKANQFKKGLTSENFESKIAEAELKTWDTGFFEQNGIPRDTGRIPTFNDEIFSLQPEAITDIHEGSFGYVIGKLVEIKAPYIPEMDTVSQALKIATRKDKSIKLVAEKADKAYKMAQKEDSLEKVSKKYDKEIVSAGFVNSNGWIKDLGQQVPLFEEAFNKESGDYGSYTVEGKGIVVYKVVDKKEVDPEKFKLEKDSIADSIRNEQFYKIYGGIMDNLMSKVEIIRNEEFVRRAQGSPEPDA